MRRALVSVSLLLTLAHPAAAQNTRRLDAAAFRAGLRLLELDQRRGWDEFRKEKELKARYEAMTLPLSRAWYDVVRGGPDAWETLRKLEPRAAVPENARYHAACSASSSGGVAGIFTFGESSLGRDEVKRRVAEMRRRAEHTPESLRVRDELRAFFAARGFKATGAGSDGVERWWLPPDEMHPGLHVSLHPYNHLLVLPGDVMQPCPDLPSGPTLLMVIDGNPASSVFAAYNDTLYAKLNRDRAAVLGAARLPADDWLEFQQAVDYAMRDFVEGIRPDLAQNDPAEAAVRSGNMRHVCTYTADVIRVYQLQFGDAGPEDEESKGWPDKLRARCAAAASAPPEPVAAPAKPRPRTVAEFMTCVRSNFPEVDRLVANYDAAEKRKDAAATERARAALGALERRVVPKCGEDPRKL